jgi:hypothetical protein
VTPTSRNGWHDRVKRRAQVLEAEGRIAKTITTTPGRAFRCAPGDIKISRTAPDGSTRDQVQALEVARKRDPGAEHKGSDARWFVFAAGQWLAGGVTTKRARRTR